MTHSFTYSSLCPNVTLPEALIRVPFQPSLFPPTLLCVVIALITTRTSIIYLLVYFLFSPPEWELLQGRDVILVKAISPVPQIKPVIHWAFNNYL